MKHYTHLTPEQRYQIYNGLEEGCSQQTIAAGFISVVILQEHLSMGVVVFVEVRHKPKLGMFAGFDLFVFLALMLPVADQISLDCAVFAVLSHGILRIVS